MQLTFKHSSSRGMALLVTIVLVAIIAVILASFTALVSNENYMAARDQAWNQCIPVAEAGLEEGLSLMKNDGTQWGWTNNLATNGWSALASGVTKVSRALDSSNHYVVTININSGSPTICSVGYVSFPTAQGQITNLSRQVEITTTSNSKMPAGLICSNSIMLSGNVLIDSFDSSTNTGSTGGLYDSSKARDNIAIATASTAANAIEADGSCRIWGYLETGPGGGEVMTGVSRGGSKGYVGANGGWPPGVETNRVSNDFLFSYPGVNTLTAPSGGYPTTLSSLPTTKAWYGTNCYVSDRANLGTYSSYLFTNLIIAGGGSNPFLVNGTVTNVVTGNFGTTANGFMVINTNSTYALFVGGNITLDGGPPTTGPAAPNSITIGPHCNVLMYTPGNFTITQSGRLYIDPTSHLTVYAGGTVNLSGAGLINSANATNLTLYGLPTCTTINITASANFIGTIYAPSAAVTINGSSPFYGSCVCSSANLAGSGVFHYDEALNTSSGSSTYYVNAWQEIAVP